MNNRQILLRLRATFVQEMFKADKAVKDTKFIHDKHNHNGKLQAYGNAIDEVDEMIKYLKSIELWEMVEA